MLLQRCQAEFPNRSEVFSVCERRLLKLLIPWAKTDDAIVNLWPFFEKVSRDMDLPYRGLIRVKTKEEIRRKLSDIRATEQIISSGLPASNTVTNSLNAVATRSFLNNAVVSVLNKAAASTPTEAIATEIQSSSVVSATVTTNILPVGSLVPITQVVTTVSLSSENIVGLHAPAPADSSISSAGDIVPPSSSTNTPAVTTSAKRKRIQFSAVEDGTLRQLAQKFRRGPSSIDFKRLEEEWNTKSRLTDSSINARKLRSLQSRYDYLRTLNSEPRRKKRTMAGASFGDSDATNSSRNATSIAGLSAAGRLNQLQQPQEARPSEVLNDYGTRVPQIMDVDAPTEEMDSENHAVNVNFAGIETHNEIVDDGITTAETLPLPPQQMERSETTLDHESFVTSGELQAYSIATRADYSLRRRLPTNDKSEPFSVDELQLLSQLYKMESPHGTGKLWQRIQDRWVTYGEAKKFAHPASVIFIRTQLQLKERHKYNVKSKKSK
jgi:hypothetical protein